MGVRVATILSNVFNPFIMGFLIIVLAAFQVTVTFSDTLKLAVMLSIINVVPLAVFTIWMHKSGRIDTLFMRLKEQRTKVYALAVLLTGASCLAIYISKVSRTLLAIAMAMLIIIAASMVINLRWKISMHTTLAGAMTLVLHLFFGPIAMLSLLLLLGVGWSRIRLGYHSLAQVAAGSASVIMIMGLTLVSFGLF